MLIGVDLGGTKTEIICIESANGKELYRKRVPSPRENYAQSIENMAALVREAEQVMGRKGRVGVGIPGVISSRTGNVKNANSTWLIGHPLDKDLGAALDRSVRVENDANCFAVSEAVDGAGAGKPVVFAVIVGTGCGAGIAVNGRAIGGLNGIAGEWGHNPLPYPRAFGTASAIFERNAAQTDQIQDYFTQEEITSEYPGPLCYCGRSGCIETWLSGPGFKRDYLRVTKEEKSTHDIIAAAAEGEPKAVAALDRYAERMAKSLAGIINIVDPDVIVLGGGMSNVNALYTEVPKRWMKYLFTDTCDTVLLPPRHGDSSGVRGAAWLWHGADKEA